MSVWITVCFIAGLIFLGLFVYFLHKYSHDNASIVPAYVLSPLILIAFGVGGALQLVERNNTYSEVETKLTENNYTLYVDGKETEPEHIDIKKYNYSAYTINDEEQTVLLSTQK